MNRRARASSISPPVPMPRRCNRGRGAMLGWLMTGHNLRCAVERQRRIRASASVGRSTSVAPTQVCWGRWRPKALRKLPISRSVDLSSLCLPCHGSERDGWGVRSLIGTCSLCPTGLGHTRGSGIISLLLRFFVISLRPIQRFLAQWVSVSTEPSAFVRERIRLGDTTNLLRGAKFFLFRDFQCVLAEVATLYLLGIGNLTEPHYRLFILLTSIPFVLISFLLVKLVAPLSFKDVLHLCSTLWVREFSPVLPLL